ncbi:hypothetical protein WMF30_14200 [Sorangium sp. So ce134]
MLAGGDVKGLALAVATSAIHAPLEQRRKYRGRFTLEGGRASGISPGPAFVERPGLVALDSRRRHPLMRHPFQWIPAEQRTPLLWSLLGLVVAGGAAAAAVDKRLRTETAPWGIVSFELAGTTERARRILASWDDAARASAAFSLGVDYLLLAGYANGLALACVMGADALKKRGLPGAGLVAPLAWGQWLAGLLDATENAALLGILRGSDEALWPALARRCAQAKFCLVGAGITYALLGFLAYRCRGGRRHPG